jgi:hypothetical protein
MPNEDGSPPPLMDSRPRSFPVRSGQRFHPEKEASHGVVSTSPHVALTVRNLAVSVPWYGALFDAEPVLDEEIPPPPQVTDSTLTTLSRWRHGFEPRWDYTEKRRSETLFSVSGNLGPAVRPAFVPRPTATRHK